MERARVAAVVVARSVQAEVGRAGEQQSRDDQEDGRHQEERPNAPPHGEDASARVHSGQARAEPAESGRVPGASMSASRCRPPRAIERAYLAAVVALVHLLVRIALDP